MSYSTEHRMENMMTIDLDKLPENVLDDLHSRLEERKNPDKLIREMNARDAFDEYLNWNGITGYTDDFIEALDGIRAASDELPNRVTVMMIGKGKPICAVFEGEDADDEATNAYMTLCQKHFPDFADRCTEMLDNMSETQGEVTICMCPASVINTD